jgi:hypothetical protein
VLALQAFLWLTPAPYYSPVLQPLTTAPYSPGLPVAYYSPVLQPLITPLTTAPYSPGFPVAYYSPLLHPLLQAFLWLNDAVIAAVMRSGVVRLLMRDDEAVRDEQL